MIQPVEFCVCTLPPQTLSMRKCVELGPSRPDTPRNWMWPVAVNKCFVLHHLGNTPFISYPGICTVVGDVIMCLGRRGHNVTLHLRACTSFYSVHAVPIRLVRLANSSVIAGECIVSKEGNDISTCRGWGFSLWECTDWCLIITGINVGFPLSHRADVNLQCSI